MSWLLATHPLAPVLEEARYSYGSLQSVSHGIARGKQRYGCKACGRHFVEGDQRVQESPVVEQALAVTLSSLAQTSCGMLGKVFGVSHALAYRWLKEEAVSLPEPAVPGDMRAMACDEMGHLLETKHRSFGLS